MVSEKQLPYTVTVSLRILTGFSFAHQARCNLCVITLHIFNSDILFLSHFTKNVNTIRVYFPLMFGISVTVHSVHSNVAKIHSRLPAAMEFWLVYYRVIHYTSVRVLKKQVLFPVWQAAPICSTLARIVSLSQSSVRDFTN